MEIKEQYRTVKNEDFIRMESHIAELERFRRANRIQIDVKISDRRYHRISPFGSPTGEYVARQVILNEIIGEDVKDLYQPISDALKKEFESAAFNNQGCLTQIRSEADELDKIRREIWMEKSNLEFQKIKSKDAPEADGGSIWKWMFFGLLIAIIIILSTKSCSAQTKIKSSYIALESTYIVLNYADLHLTYKGLAHGAREANPAARWLYDKDLLIPGKIIVTGATLWMFRRMYIENPRTAYVYLIAANLIYIGVVANNYVVTLRLRV